MTYFVKPPCSRIVSFSTRLLSRNIMTESAFYDFKINDTTGRPIDLTQFKGKVILAFNSASKCGFTPQLQGFQKLHDTFKDKGLVVIGFPSNSFAQEMSTNEEVASFCQRNYGVAFPMTETIAVNGSNEHPIYGFMKKAAPGILGIKMIKWNFEKFLLDKEGKVVKRYPSGTTPESIRSDIEKLL